MDPTQNPSQYPTAPPPYPPVQPSFSPADQGFPPPAPLQVDPAAGFVWDPSAPPPLPPASTDGTRWRRWLSGALGIAGGFIVLANVNGQLPYAISGISGMPGEVALLLVAQTVFGLLVVALSYFSAPGPVASRAIGIGLFVLGAIGVTALQIVRYTEGSGGPVLAVILHNPHAWLVLLGALGWLLAMRPRPLVYLSLLAAILLFLPINFNLVVAGVDSALTTLIMLVLSLAVAVVVLVAGALRERRR